MKKTILNWVFFFALFVIIFQVFFNNNAKEETSEPNGPLTLEMTKDDYSAGQEVIMKIKNDTDQPVSFKLPCPKNPFRVLRAENNEFKEIIAETQINCDDLQTLTVDSKKSQTVSFSFWNHALFGSPGRYKIEVPSYRDDTSVSYFSTKEFTISQRGTWGAIWNTIFYQPIYNGLIALISVSPGKSLAVAIMLLTIIIRLILLIPSQRAMQSQRRMQDLQPKLEHIKQKYKGNQEKIAKETMAIWKEHKVNPFGSCLPLIIQFPILIALFYVIQNGLNPDNIYLLYQPLKGFDLLSIKTNFLGILELRKVNLFVLPLIIGLLQFFQMKLMMAKRQKGGESQPSELQMMNSMMTYFMPVLIAVFTASVPAGVGLYWGVSTLFGIGQQLVVNKQSLTKDTKHAIIEGEITKKNT